MGPAVAPVVRLAVAGLPPIRCRRRRLTRPVVPLRASRARAHTAGSLAATRLVEVFERLEGLAGGCLSRRLAAHATASVHRAGLRPFLAARLLPVSRSGSLSAGQLGWRTRSTIFALQALGEVILLLLFALFQVIEVAKVDEASLLSLARVRTRSARDGILHFLLEVSPFVSQLRLGLIARTVPAREGFRTSWRVAGRTRRERRRRPLAIDDVWPSSAALVRRERRLLLCRGTAHPAIARKLTSPHAQRWTRVERRSVVRALRVDRECRAVYEF